jgi:hypothetical protein
MIRIASVAALVVLAAASTSRAQFGGIRIPRIDRPSDLDPFNRNSGIREGAHELDNQRLNAIQGTPYVFTIRNPNPHAVNFRVNGMPFLVMGNQAITIRGRGTPEITFDIGGGDGTYQKYNLLSGRTYEFLWRLRNVPEVGRMNLLDLYAK